MKTKIASLCSLGLCIIGLLALPACATNTPTDTARIARVVNEAARIGSTEVLTAHPEWRPQFQAAADSLHILAASTNLSVQTILDVAHQLPVQELKSDEARLAFAGATLLISAIDVPELPADRVAQLQPIARAIADGISFGIALAPTPPPKVKLPPVPTVPPSTVNVIVPPTTTTLELPATNSAN